MTTLPLYQVDAFSDHVFGGNPAAVCVLRTWLPDPTLQAIAAENNLSETAFILPDEDPVPLRWFTPTHEVPLCGHATMAAGFVVLTQLRKDRASVSFTSMSGPLTVTSAGRDLSLDFPAVPLDHVERPPAALADGLNLPVSEVWVTPSDPNYLVIVDDQDTVESVEPDFRSLTTLHPHGVAVSAPGHSADFVSRYFAPSYGIPEDPVTGSIHCALGPYWAERFGRQELNAVQLSDRGGRVGVRVASERVHLRGRAALYLSGRVELPADP